ncbi:glutathione-dependent disulfide-bond oxidoreductase [Novosphingobium bradum]|uniref:Glutathione-dependent disulfide-bond oxidoreductase n=1 Tax=Novosphingobium bradum TaxID=1737444 RepID=A0ABV7IM57_9SPHN
MAEDPTYVPPAVWQAPPLPEGMSPLFALNRPVSGATHERDLPVGRHPLQLYSMATPNGQKVGILLEELLAAGHAGAEYDAWKIAINEGDQFSTGFVDINPNSKIPALVDRSGAEPVRVFESGAILIYLAEKFGAFLPREGAARAETLSWLMWQMGSAPFLGGGFGHFYAYAPVKIEYAINRYAMEVKRLMHVADTRLAETRYLAGDAYTIADMAFLPWAAGLWRGTVYNDARTFLAMDDYPHLGRWVEELLARPAVARGRKVTSQDLPERHGPEDFDSLAR